MGLRGPGETQLEMDRRIIPEAVCLRSKVSWRTLISRRLRNARIVAHDSCSIGWIYQCG